MKTHVVLYATNMNCKLDKCVILMYLHPFSQPDNRKRVANQMFSTISALLFETIHFLVSGLFEFQPILTRMEVMHNGGLWH